MLSRGVLPTLTKETGLWAMVGPVCWAVRLLLSPEPRLNSALPQWAGHSHAASADAGGKTLKLPPLSLKEM